MPSFDPIYAPTLYMPFFQPQPYMKVVISEPVLRGGYTGLKVHHNLDRRARKLKIGELTVYGLNFRNHLTFLKNLIFFGREVVSKSAMRVFPL